MLTRTLALLLALVFLPVQSLHASVTAGDIFGMISGGGATTSIDRGGAIHSQARSIYSFGGGMTSFQGKRVSLLAADPPSFSAGCSGISWHFGGFSFISMDEIRQMVEAISQAALGIVVDLAMQTLCPQCYAVMSKLRDMANAMRNASMDACQIGRTMGAMVWKSMNIQTPEFMQKECSTTQSSKGVVSSVMAGEIGAATCSAMAGIGDFMKERAPDIEKAFGNKPGAKPLTQAQKMMYGNTTYNGLTALGYEDGFIKDALMSMLGYTVVHPEPGGDCSKPFKNIKTSAAQNVSPAIAEGNALAADGFARLDAMGRLLKSVVPKGPTAATATVECDGSQGPCPQHPESTAHQAPDNATAADVKKPSANTSGTTDGDKGVLTCNFPPLITDVAMLGGLLICGFNPDLDMSTFQRRFAALGPIAGADTLSWTCGLLSRSAEATAGPTQPNNYLLETAAKFRQYEMYQCSGAVDHLGCLTPRTVSLKERLTTTYAAAGSGAYSGLAFMIMDALFRGVEKIKTNQPIDADTLAILNNSGYPLYRLLNIAAVYPGVAVELLQAYSVIIAMQYVLDTLTKMTAPGGAVTQYDLSPRSAVTQENMRQLRAEILEMNKTPGEFKSQVLSMLAEKQTLVNRIVEVNRALQAEVVSQGLAGNADLATSIKQRQTAAHPPVPNP